MKKVDFIEKLRRLESEVGPQTSKALIELLEVEMNEFKSYIDQRFATLQWMLGVGFTAISLGLTAIAVFK